jgi:hypothetical protein
VSDDDVGAAIPRLRNPWLSKLLKTQWLGILSILISGVALYLTYFWKPDDLVVYFRFANPNEIGTSQLHLNYIFSNSGKTPAFIEDVSLTEVFYQSNADGSAIPNMDICKDESIQTPTFVALMQPALQSQPMLHQKEGWYSRLYTPKTIYSGGIQSPFSSLNIDVGAQRAISAVYEMDAIDWNKFNVVLLCPVIRFFDSSGHPSTAICDGFQGDQFLIEKNGPKGTRSSPAGLARLLPTSSSNCRIAAY